MGIDDGQHIAGQHQVQVIVFQEFEQVEQLFISKFGRPVITAFHPFQVMPEKGADQPGIQFQLFYDLFDHRVKVF